ncbi:uncharacterized protein BX664DRAFT_363677 [Halteromyces radiatus]|uniref:uncharacterized protein n=1 Tax=Halteromyces radiatus TaxID=101107 RepID=UPI0022202A8D|nr:uncharacterized protein BX664DRAFT_363677 [Halteromyces radiatus]KAI8100067.1 hypothetical protein BX664DRAFT_363677 [Halteromyces radiatus]
MADPDLDIYIDWVQQNGGTFDKLKFVKDQDGNGRSVFASKTINVEDKFATVPFKLAITEPLARKAFPNLGDFSCRVVLTLFVAHQKALGSSFYAPYLNILPKIIKTALTFDDNDMKYLRNTNLAVAACERLALLRSDYERLMSDFVDDTVKNLVTCAITSRSFPYKLIDPTHSGTSEVLFPLVDSLNHKPNTKITWSRDGDTETGSLSFVAGQSFTLGEQVFNNYGPKSNEECKS